MLLCGSRGQHPHLSTVRRQLATTRRRRQEEGAFFWQMKGGGARGNSWTCCARRHSRHICVTNAAATPTMLDERPSEVPRCRGGPDPQSFEQNLRMNKMTPPPAAPETAFTVLGERNGQPIAILRNRQPTATKDVRGGRVLATSRPTNPSACACVGSDASSGSWSSRSTGTGTDAHLQKGTRGLRRRQGETRGRRGGAPRLSPVCVRMCWM